MRALSQERIMNNFIHTLLDNAGDDRYGFFRELYGMFKQTIMMPGIAERTRAACWEQIPELLEQVSVPALILG